MVNKVFDVSAEFDTCRQVIVESGVTSPYLDLILGKSVPNPHTPIFGDPKYGWLTPLSTYVRYFGKCSSAECKDVAVERDLLCALVARDFPFGVPNKKGTPTPIIRLLALVWHAYGAVETWREDRTVMLRFPSSEPPGWGKCTSTGRLKGVKVTAQSQVGGEAAQSDEGAQQAEGVQQVQSTTPLKWQTVLQAAVAAGVQHGYMGADIPEWEVRIFGLEPPSSFDATTLLPSGITPSFAFHEVREWNDDIEFTFPPPGREFRGKGIFGSNTDGWIDQDVSSSLRRQFAIPFWDRKKMLYFDWELLYIDWYENTGRWFEMRYQLKLFLATQPEDRQVELITQIRQERLRIGEVFQLIQLYGRRHQNPYVPGNVFKALALPGSLQGQVGPEEW